MPRNLTPADASIKAVRDGDARKRLTDGDGLYLLLFVKGGAHGWRLDYSFQGRRKTLSLGTYPSRTLIWLIWLIWLLSVKSPSEFLCNYRCH